MFTSRRQLEHWSSLYYKPEFHYADFHRNFAAGKVADANHENRVHKSSRHVKMFATKSVTSPRQSRLCHFNGMQPVTMHGESRRHSPRRYLQLTRCTHHLFAYLVYLLVTLRYQLQIRAGIACNSCAFIEWVEFCVSFLPGRKQSVALKRWQPRSQ